ncbi:MAG: terminase small subunit, partial [Acutalibacteraceae bacterium]
MLVTNERLTKKERVFCETFVQTGSVENALIKAGFKPGEETKLFSKESVRKAILKISENHRKMINAVAKIGYEKLAFGSIVDAVSLLYMENPSKEEISKLNLFMVSEIKKAKDGKMEIKFFDRMASLDKICDEKEYESDDSFFEALEKSSKSVCNNGENYYL